MRIASVQAHALEITLAVGETSGGETNNTVLLRFLGAGTTVGTEGASRRD